MVVFVGRGLLAGIADALFCNSTRRSLSQIACINYE